MSRLRQRPQDAPVTLLPFLAVLICTMGALIVLLVVVVQQARVKGTQVVDIGPTPPTATEPPSPPADGLASNQQTIDPTSPSARTGPTAAEVSRAEQARDKYLWEIRLLAESRTQTLERLNEKRLELSHLEEHTRRLAAQLDQLQNDARQGAARLAGQTDETLQAELAEVEQQIAATKQQLESTQQAAAARRDTFQLIPYTGSRGTTRRPIYVECLPDAVVIQPEGVRLVAEDFTLSQSAGNPLAAALRAVREYWLATGGDTQRGEPYPLLVVRPGGETAYGACRQALRSWDDEFGYELIPSGVKLSYPPADPQLALEIEKAVDLSRRQQQQLKGFLALQDTGGPVYRASRSNGGFVREGGSSRPSGRSGFSGSGFSAAGSPGSSSPGSSSPGSSSPGSSSPGSSSPGSSSSGSSSSGSDSAVSDSSNSAGSNSFGSNSYDSAYSGSNSFATDAFESPGPTETDLYSPQTADNGNRDGLLADSLPPNGSQPNFDRASRFQLTPPTSSAQGPSSAGPPSSALGSRTASGGPTSGGPPSGGPSSGGPPSGGTTSANPFPASLAKTRGADWALPNAARGAIPIRRPLYVTVNGGQLVLEPEPGTNEVPHNIPFEDSTIVAVQNMVASIWKRIEGWGVAGPGVYWKPTMEVAVTPDGETRFRELASLLLGSGIELKRR